MDYISEVNSIISPLERYALVHTYGCQQNVADSERIKGMLIMMGYKLTEDINKADLILYNTCAIREHAENRVIGNVGALKKLKEKKRGLIVALCGCMMQQDRIADIIKEKYPFVNILFGTHVIHRFPEFVFKILTGEKRVFCNPDSEGEIFEGLPIKRDSDLKAWVSIMYGCDNFCTYCVVPYVRGRERSRKPEDVIGEVKELINKGYKEITLLGQNVNSYGKKFAKPYTFAQLLREIDSIDGDYIIRFMTSHPKDASRELIDTIAESRHIAHQLHLPAQSGSSRILKAMNRHYDRESYIDLALYAREKIPDLAISTDIIVGFPYETEEDFKETLSLVERVRYDAMFAFCYSRRPGTPADKMDGQIEMSVKSERFARLMELQERVAMERNQNLVGKKLRVLIDGQKEDKLTARTSGNILVEVAGDKNLIGQFKNIIITEAQAWQLKAEVTE